MLGTKIQTKEKCVEHVDALCKKARSKTTMVLTNYLRF